MRYKLETRMQDEGWNSANINWGYDYLDQAIDWAMEQDGFYWGMIRIIDTTNNQVMAEFPAVSSKQKKRPNLPSDKVNYTKKGDSMVRKEFIYAMLGVPIVQVELDDGQYVEIANRVKRVIEAYSKKNIPAEMLSVLEEEGVLAHVKYAIGRIRAKYNTMPGLGDQITLDGRELAAEGLESIRWWYDMLKAYCL